MDPTSDEKDAVLYLDSASKKFKIVKRNLAYKFEGRLQFHYIWSVESHFAVPSQVDDVSVQERHSKRSKEIDYDDDKSDGEEEEGDREHDEEGDDDGDED